MAGLEDDAGAAGEDPARLLVVRQAALAETQRSLAEAALKEQRLRRLRLRVGIALRMALMALLLLLILLLLAAAIAALRSKALIVHRFDVPEAVARSGATGEALAGSVADELNRLGRSRTGGEEVRSAALAVPASEAMPLARLRRLFGSDTHIGGSVFRLEDGVLRLTVRGDGVEARSFNGRASDLPLLGIRAAEHVFGSIRPTDYLLYLGQSGRPAAAAEFAPLALQRARGDRERSTVAGLWAQALAALGRTSEAQAQARFALSLDARNWYAQAASVELAADDQAALLASRALRDRSGDGSADRKPAAAAFATEYRLTQDWTRLVLLYGQAGPGSRPAFLAEAEAHRHDHEAARRALAGGDPADPLIAAAANLIAGLRELDLGRADRAVDPLERFHRSALARPELGRLFRGDRCYLALAYARLGRSRDAEQLLDWEPQSARCAAFRGDVLTLSGDWDAARRAYREAMSLAPASPVPFERAATALLAREQPEAAARLFQAAIARGPNWADPRFGLAEAMMQLGHFKEAETQYRAAARFAPQWGALHVGWGEALSRIGRQREAQAIWRSAAGMDLGPPSRTRLWQLLGPAGDGGRFTPENAEAEAQGVEVKRASKRHRRSSGGGG